jgi:hypothetical protein
MPTSLDFRLYTNLTAESFLLVTPSLVATLEPDFLCYSSELSIVFCKVCREALSGKASLTKHITQPPHQQYWRNLEKSKRTSIISTLRSHSLVSYHALPEIPPNTYYFEQLPVIFDTFNAPTARTSRSMVKRLDNIESTLTIFDGNPQRNERILSIMSRPKFCLHGVTVACLFRSYPR